MSLCDRVIRPGMGTAATGPLLRAVVRLVRPLRVLEIGAGYSTICLAQGLADAVSDVAADREALSSQEFSELATILRPTVDSDYYPMLVSVDDHSGIGTSAREAWDRIAADVDLSQFVSRVENDFFAIRDKLAAMGPYDLVWIDAGTPVDDVRFLEFAWTHLAPGGMIAFHEPYLTTTVEMPDGHRLRTVPSPLWLELRRRSVDMDVDLLALPEWQKYRQGGVGLIRRRVSSEAPRGGTFGDEMAELGEAPVRFDYTGFGRQRTGPEQARSMLSLLNGDSLRVFGAVASGATKLDRVAMVSGTAKKDCAKKLGRLVSAGLVLRSEEGYTADLSSLAKLLPHRVDLDGEAQLDVTTMNMIVRPLRGGVVYSEGYINRLCEAFVSDFALARRTLVDNGVLGRNSEGYYLPEGSVFHR